ncbi:MAG: hypothetical protein II381_02335, partial [Victivallales bacterium]|nr:hypothetical protein [Victivallales bacterium]
RAALRRNGRKRRPAAKGDNHPCQRRAFALLRLARSARRNILDLISGSAQHPGRTFPAGVFIRKIFYFF